MKKRLCSLLLTLLLLTTLPPAAFAAGFADVPENHWAYADITAAAQAGLFQGVTATHFGLGSTITRAQFVTALVRLFGWSVLRPDTPSYSDCDASRWYYAAVETAHANGALPSYATTFRPEDPVTREEMASMLVRGLGYSTLAGQMAEIDLPFHDVSSNRGYIAVAYDFGIVNGYDDGAFHPRAVAAREEAAVMLMRVYRKLHAESVPVTAEGGYIPIAVDTPRASAATSIPTTPLEPLENLYAILRRYREAGTDMNKVALCLTAGGAATTTQGSKILSTETVSAAAVRTYLDSTGVRTYYSDQYQSAYLILPGEETTLTVWYQSPESQAAKLQLGRMFGITHNLLQDV